MLQTLSNRFQEYKSISFCSMEINTLLMVETKLPQQLTLLYLEAFTMRICEQSVELKTASHFPSFDISMEL